jgi:hypothetical protein
MPSTCASGTARREGGLAIAWDKTLPTGSTAVSASDNAIRANWEYIRDAFNQEHGDPDANPSDASQIVHLQGSARVIVYTGATELDSSADVVAQVSQLYHDSRDVGRIVYDANTSGDSGRIWICTATDTFVSVPSVQDALTLEGLLTAEAGIVVPSGQTLQLASGENSLTDGSTAFDLWLHNSRHELGGDDALLNLIASLNWAQDTTGGTLTTTEAKLDEVTIDMTGRSASSHVFMLALFGKSQSAGSTASFALHIGLDSGGTRTAPSGGNLPTGVSASPFIEGPSNSTFAAPVFMFTEIRGLSAASHTFELWGASSSGTVPWDNSLICVLDLGLQ